MYLERRRNRWHAFHDIPAELQGLLGRRRFAASLKTEERQIAEQRAARLLSEWLRVINEARRSPPAPHNRDKELVTRALELAASLENAGAHDRDFLLELIRQEMMEIIVPYAAARGVYDSSDERYGELAIHETADRFVAMATGRTVPSDHHLTAYLNTLQSGKTKDQKRSSLLRFCTEFPDLRKITTDTVQDWLDQKAAAGRAYDTVSRELSDVRGYWRYLQAKRAVPRDSDPFRHLVRSGGRQFGRRAFEAEEIVALLNAARREDPQLADLIELARWTGARIEELCSLRCSSVHGDYFDILASKTPAGRRRVPIHPHLRPVLRRLIDCSSDGYVLSGLKPDRYGDRSQPVGKRFGRLRTRMGFSPGVHVFHSIRKTVITLLERARVPENVAADIVGHKKTTITYGLYSEGTSMELRMAEISKLSYPDRPALR